MIKLVMPVNLHYLFLYLKRLFKSMLQFLKLIDFELGL